MGCNCKNKRGCSTKLTGFYNKVTTLYNTTTDPQKKQVYKGKREEISSYLKNQTCPSNEIIGELQTFINNEYNQN